MSTKRTCHLALGVGLMLSLWALGCSEPNPAYRGPSDLQDAGAGKDAPEADVKAGIPDSAPSGRDGNRDGNFRSDLDAVFSGQPETAGEVDGSADVLDGHGPLDIASSDARDSRDARRGDEPLLKDLADEADISVDGMVLDVADDPSADYPIEHIEHIEIDALFAVDATGKLDGEIEIAVDSR